MLGIFTAEQSKYYRLYLLSGMITFTVINLRRFLVGGRSSAAGMTLAVKLPVEDPAQSSTHAGRQKHGISVGPSSKFRRTPL